MTPELAILRGGHRHPDQILDDLAREGFAVVPLEYAKEAVDMWISRGGTLKKLINGEWDTEIVDE